MKAIETEYNGVRFRSRLEARWALFFDALRIQWQYEPEGYELRDGTRYLPDFYLPTFSGGVYVEVKPLGDAFTKARAFAAECDRSVWLCDGEPERRTWTVLTPPRGKPEEGEPAAEVYEDSRLVPCPDRNRFWGEPSDADIEWFIGYAVNLVRAYRFWNPRGART